MTRQRLSGWGRTSPSIAEVVTPRTEEEVSTLLATNPGVAARGLGRSYGDPAQLAGGLVLDNRGFTGIGPIDEFGVVEVGAGVSIDELLAVMVPLGWFMPVTPGTRQVTIGGAIAADVHGKNHHVEGSIASHVRSMRLVTPVGSYTVTPNDDAELFWATMGAMGLTGFVTSVTIAMLRIETDRVLVDTTRYSNLERVMTAMLEGDADYRYSVAWVDCMTKGANMGRAILTRGDHARTEDLDHRSLAGPHGSRLAVPNGVPSGLLNTASIKVFNELWFRSARDGMGRAHSLSSFFHPLDGVKDWNRMYGRRGFVQYQFCVPDDQSQTIVDAIATLSSSGVASFLGVLKRFGAADPGHLSFPTSGWTLALDLPLGSHKLSEVLDRLDDMVLDGNGRIYLAKDARLDPATLAAMYPRLGEFLEVKARVDPDHRLTSDLARRLQLTGQ